MHWKKSLWFPAFRAQGRRGVRNTSSNCGFGGPGFKQWRLLTYPLRHMTSRASRYPWWAARRVGVIPSSSEVLRSFLVASFSRSTLPSAAALWYRLDIFSSFWFPKAALSNTQTVQSLFHYRDRSLMITSWDIPVRRGMGRQSSSLQALPLELCIRNEIVVWGTLSFPGRWLCRVQTVCWKFDYLERGSIHLPHVFAWLFCGNCKRTLNYKKNFKKTFKRPWLSVWPGFTPSNEVSPSLMGGNARAVTCTGEALCNPSFTGMLPLKTSHSPAKPGTSMEPFCVHRLEMMTRVMFG